MYLGRGACKCNFYADRVGSNNKLHGSLKFLPGSLWLDERLFMIWYGAIKFSDELIRSFEKVFRINVDR